MGRRYPTAQPKLTSLTNGVWGGSLWTTRERIAAEGRCGAVKAVQAARPVNDDTSKTSVSEGKSGEEESLDITQPLCQKYNLLNGLLSHTIQVMGI